MSVPTDLRKTIEEDLVLIEQGKETYGTLAKRHNVPIRTLYRLHQEKLQRIKVEEAKDTLEALEEKKERLEQEINKLTRETEEIKASFAERGLDWEQGIQTVKAITDLDAGLKKLRGEGAATKARLKEERNKLDAAKRQISNLNGRKQKLDGDINELLGIYHRYMNWYRTEAPRLEERESALRISIYHLEKKEGSLKENVERLSGEEEEAKKRISKLRSEEEVWNRRIQKLRSDYEGEKKRLQKESEKTVGELRSEEEALEGKIEKLRKEYETIREESEKLVANRKKTIAESRELAEKIVKDAEQKKERLLGEVEELKKEKGILKAEIELLRAAPNEEIQKLRKKLPENSSPEEFSALEKGSLNVNVENEALIRLTRLEETLDKIIKQRQEMRRESP